MSPETKEREEEERSSGGSPDLPTLRVPHHGSPDQGSWVAEATWGEGNWCGCRTLSHGLRAESGLGNLTMRSVLAEELGGGRRMGEQAGRGTLGSTPALYRQAALQHPADWTRHCQRTAAEMRVDHEDARRGPGAGQPSS